MPEMTEIDSSLLSAYSYNPDTNTLRLRFRKNGAEWDYLKVPEANFEKFKESPSQGRFFLHEIKGKFDERKVERA